MIGQAVRLATSILSAAGMLLPATIMAAPANREPASKCVVFLVDCSISAAAYRQSYLDAMHEVVQKLNRGDAVAVVRITASSITEPDIPVKVEIEKLKLEDQFGRPIESEMIRERILRNDKAKLQAIREDVFKRMNEFMGKVGNGTAKNTDIMSAITLGERLLKGYRREVGILVVLSDMIEDSADYHFERDKLNDRRRKEIIRLETESGRLPDIKGIRVHVVAPAGVEKNKFFELQNFWLEYFRAAGASISKEDYGNTLLSFGH